ncbi:hypothetical protein NIES593_11670 [Hydrococcus rivularis NIES-593]|uniref:Uncharacterized protein n=1 Tax=Hydrococcus rivularis NIES-593 TaxID=1921803 RepID=A0A1U7HGU6_9CYAN|nr:hypothetical protein [Hydrococcus rivularis]OKH22775.1 hypothetical protein NIES593_11670 [Hydrococcus rivularis NIES-593]
MTELPERAIAQLKTLPADEQDAIAAMILEEIEDERRWDESFSRSPNILAKLAASAMAEYHGIIKPFYSERTVSAPNNLPVRSPLARPCQNFF